MRREAKNRARWPRQLLAARIIVIGRRHAEKARRVRAVSTLYGARRYQKQANALARCEAAYSILVMVGGARAAARA